MDLLLKVTVDIFAKLLNLCSKAVLCSWSEGKDKLAHLAMICPWLMLRLIVSKNGGRLGRLKQPNCCSLHFLSSLFINSHWDQFSSVDWHCLATLRDCCSPSILRYLSSVRYYLPHDLVHNMFQMPLQWSELFIVEMVMIWYCSSSFTLDDGYCPQYWSWLCQVTFLIITEKHNYIMFLPHIQLLNK